MCNAKAVKDDGEVKVATLLEERWREEVEENDDGDSRSMEFFGVAGHVS